MIVRPIRADEHDALAEVTLSAYRHLLGPDMSAGYAAELADVGTRAGLVDVLVAVDDHGVLAGGIAYVPGPGPMAWFTDPAEAGMRMLAVAPGAQGRGVGALLIGACVARGIAAGKSRLLLHTTSPMTAAQRLYERAGFRRLPDHDVVLEGGLLLLTYVLDLEGYPPSPRPGGGIGQTRRA